MMDQTVPWVMIGEYSNKIVFYSCCLMFFAMPLGTSVFTVAGFLTLLAWFLSGEFFRQRDLYLKAAWFLPVSAVVLLVWLGLIWSMDPSGLGKKYAEKTYYWLFGLAVASICYKPHGLDKLFWSFLAGLLLNAILGLLQVMHIIPNFSQAIATGLHGGYNTLAILLILGMLMASYYFKLYEKKRHKIVFIFLVIIFFLQLINIQGRGGYLTFLILAPFMFHQFFKNKIKRLILFYILSSLIMISSPVVWNRIHTLVEDFQAHRSDSVAIVNGSKYSDHVDRIFMWRWAIGLFLKNPLLGVGTGGYAKAILNSGGDKAIAHPHNNVLYVAVSFGMLGLVIFGWLFWVLLKIGWQNRDHPAGFFIFSSVLVILIGGLVDTPILDAGGAFLLSITTGLCSVFSLKKAAHPQSTESTEPL